MSLRARHLWLLALAALALRGPLLLLSPGEPFTLESYARVAGVAGAGLYASAETAGRYPYPPLWWALLRALKGLQSLFGGDFALWSRLPGLAGDVLVSACAYLIVERRSRSSAALSAGPEALLSTRAGLLAGLAWALNPLAALVSGAQGQFDSLPLGLLLLAAWWLEYAADDGAELRAALCVAAAIALKSWPLAFLPLYLGVFSSRREAVRFALWSLLPPLLSLVPWLWMDGAPAVLSRLAFGGATALGLGGALRACLFAADAPVELYRRVDDAWRLASMALLALGWLWLLARARRLRILDGLAWVALSLVLLAPGLPPQALLWPAAFSLLLGGGYALRYNLAALPLALAFYALFMPSVLAGPAAWEPPRLPAVLTLLWSAVNLAWWAWCLNDWLRLSRLNRAPRRAGIFR